VIGGSWKGNSPSSRCQMELGYPSDFVGSVKLRFSPTGHLGLPKSTIRSVLSRMVFSVPLEGAKKNLMLSGDGIYAKPGGFHLMEKNKLYGLLPKSGGCRNSIQIVLKEYALHDLDSEKCGRDCKRSSRSAERWWSIMVWQVLVLVHVCSGDSASEQPLRAHSLAQGVAFDSGVVWMT
jgi:hypothetical protein